ncbi:hypothetical protein BH23ACT6_BH23ACT6_14420 [soil metagenome]
MVLTTRTEPIDGVKSRAQRMHVDLADDGELRSLRTVATSLNGAPPKAIPAGTDLENVSSDPCGGCVGCGPGSDCEHLTDECNWEATWQCVVSAGGCAYCVRFAGWFPCIACALLACPLAVDACCTSTNEVCGASVFPT